MSNLTFYQPGQPALLHDGVHEDVARVEEGGAKLRQEQAEENLLEDTTESSPED